MGKKRNGSEKNIRRRRAGLRFCLQLSPLAGAVSG